jgi:hypothetical protein
MISCRSGLSWGAIVGEPPTVWGGPLSIDVALTGELLDRTCAVLAAQAGQTEAVRAVIGEKRYRDHPAARANEQSILLMSNIPAMETRATQEEGGAR